MKGSEEFTYEFPEMSPAERLKELILYIADKLKDDPNFGRTKLAKIIYFADMESFRMHRRPVTGTAFIRMTHGPLPKNFLNTLDELKEEGRIVEIEREYFDYTQKRIVVRSGTSADLFSEAELGVVDGIIQKFRDWNAVGLSEKSHGVAWRLTGEGKPVPYEYALFSDEPLTEAEMAHAKDLARRFQGMSFD